MGRSLLLVRWGTNLCRRSSDERCSELKQLQHFCNCRSSVVKDLRLLKCGGLDKTMAVPGIFGTDFTSTLFGHVGKRRSENRKRLRIYVDIRLDDQCRVL